MIHWLTQVGSTAIDLLLQSCRHHLVQLRWTTQCQPGKPLVMLLNEWRPFFLPMLFSIFTPMSCQTEVYIQTGHHSPSQPFSERCRWPVAASSPSPPLSQSSSHVDLLQRSQTNTELFAVSGPLCLLSPPGMILLSTSTCLAASHHSAVSPNVTSFT